VSLYALIGLAFTVLIAVHWADSSGRRNAS
jgi:hypothetical protein